MWKNLKEWLRHKRMFDRRYLRLLIIDYLLLLLLFAVLAMAMLFL